jgi:excisionase family DNA binding protein
VSGEPLLTAAEVAERLGFSAAWVLDRFEAGDLPGIRFGEKGGRVRFDPADVNDFLDQRRTGSRVGGGQLQEAER